MSQVLIGYTFPNSITDQLKRPIVPEPRILSKIGWHFWKAWTVLHRNTEVRNGKLHLLRRKSRNFQERRFWRVEIKHDHFIKLETKKMFCLFLRSFYLYFFLCVIIFLSRCCLWMLMNWTFLWAGGLSDPYASIRLCQYFGFYWGDFDRIFGGRRGFQRSIDTLKGSKCIWRF